MEDACRDLTVSTRWLRGLLIVDAALSVTSLASDFYARAASGEAKDTSDLIQGLIGGAQAVAALATFILAGTWIYRSARNVRALGARDLGTSPGWAVGWYFIPIGNLFKPYQAISEIWRASTNPAAWREVRVPAILPVWWSAWLISNILDLQVAKLVLKDNPATNTSTLLSATSDVMDLASDLAFFAVVGGLWKLQDRNRLPISMDQVFSGQEERDASTREV